MLLTLTLPKASSTIPLRGIPYYLPKVIIPITIAGSSTLTTPKANSNGASDASNSPPGSGTKSTTGSTTATATASPQVTVNVQAAQGKSISTTGSTASPLTIQVSQGAPIFVADPQQGYFLSYQLDPFFDDKFSLSIDANGLLESANGQSTDETGAAVAALVQFAETVAKYAPAGEILNLPKKSEKCQLTGFSKTINYDTDNADAGMEIIDGVPIWHLAQYIDAKASANSQIMDATIVATPSRVSQNKPLSATDASGAIANGVLFRLAIPWTIKVTVQPNPSAEAACHIHKILWQANVLVPNDGPILAQDVSREALVSKQVNLAFKSGMLQSVAPTSPSPVLAAAKLPITVLQPIFSLPLAGVTSAVSAGSSTKTLDSSGTNSPRATQ